MSREAARSRALWREPVQERSRVRVAGMLEAGSQILAERGLEGLTMEGVAERAGVPIGSLYQFFPDRNALLARLFSRLLESTDPLIEERFREVDSVAKYHAAGEGLAASLYQAVASDPALVEVWSAVQALRVLRHLDAEASRRHAKILFEAGRTLAPDSVSDERLARACFLVCDLLASVIRTALELGGRDGELLADEYAAMAASHLRSVLQGSDV